MKKYIVFIIAISLVLPVSGGEKYIKYVDFTPTAEAMRDALAIDVNTLGENHAGWVELLAAYAAKTGGSFKNYKKSKLTAIAGEYAETHDMTAVSGNEKLFKYYLEAYGAVLDGLAGSYTEVSADGTFSQKYGLYAAHPIAAGYGWVHYDDFGASRSFGYKREHLGHDLSGSVGTPVVAVEGGYVSALGWNMYGGWRVGISSFDGKRYWYYAHLRKNHPYADLYLGKTVGAGEVIGYLGMTGYSRRENTNNIDSPHLHYGLQLIFDESQRDGYNQIWVDMYELTKLLAANRSVIHSDVDGDEYVSESYRYGAGYGE